MANVNVHDTYAHYVDSEGYYFGWTGAPPSHLFPNLEIYNNRIIRTGSETLQIQDLGDVWEQPPLPADDLRVDPSSLYASMGVR